MWFHGVMVSTLDSESSDPSSNLGGTCSLCPFVVVVVVVMFVCLCVCVCVCVCVVFCFCFFTCFFFVLFWFDFVLQQKVIECVLAVFAYLLVSVYFSACRSDSSFRFLYLKLIKNHFIQVSLFCVDLRQAMSISFSTFCRH